jgi:hypothetical protein
MGTSVGNTQRPLDTVDDDNNNNRTINAGDVLRRAEHLSHGGNQFSKYCAQYAENAVTGGAGLYNRALDWQNEARKLDALNTTKQAPAGVPVFFNTSNPAKHVAISAGNGMIWSTDGAGNRIAKVPQSRFGGYAGWTSMVGGRGERQYINYSKDGLKALGSAVASGTSSRMPKPSPSAQAAPKKAPRAALNAMAADMSSGPVGTDLTQLNPTRAVQSSSGSSSMVVR